MQYLSSNSPSSPPSPPASLHPPSLPPSLPPRSLSEVPSSVLPYFSEAAAQFIEEKGPTEALAAALAYISGSTEIVSRSLLSAQQVCLM